MSQYFLHRHLSVKLLTFITALFIACTATDQASAAFLGSSQAMNSGKEFTQVAKKATPCVVSIKTLFKKGPNYSENGYGEQMDPFQDEFWQRFFGMPPSNPRQEKRAPRYGQGSGFIVSQDGLIMTNNHVVQDGEEITVTLNNGKEYPATVVGQDPNTDVALLKIDAKDLPFLTLGDSNDLEVGEWVMAIGNPLGLQASVTVGVVSAKGRNDLDITRVEEFIQTDAAINLGNSGGCLLNMEGEAIGMNTAIASNTGGYMGIGFAIPSNLLKHDMKEILEHGKVVRGFLGVILQKIDNDLAQAFNLEKTEGALVTEVMKESPADKAGIKAGDIILKINNQPIENVGSLRTTISMMHPNDKVILTVKRNDKIMDIAADISSHPDNELAASEIQSNLGVLVQELTPDVAQQLGLTEDKGVVIKYVNPNSLAQEAGLKRGQLIMSVNQIPVQTAEEFYSALRECAKKKQILLHVKSGQVVRFVTIKIR